MDFSEKKKYLEKFGDIYYEFIGYSMWDGEEFILNGRTEFRTIISPEYIFYDKDGNIFYSNCESLKKAEELIEKLALNGKKAIIGPAAPINAPDGSLVSNPNSNAVGIYIIKELEMTKDGSNKTLKLKR